MPLCLVLISHKLHRWLVPYSLIALFALNLMVLDYAIYCLSLMLQLAFYFMALLGWLWQRKGKAPCMFGIPFSFCLVNLAALVGVARFVVGKKSGRWQPVRS